jgi:dihydroorotate dehydrogenase (fumarate)
MDLSTKYMGFKLPHPLIPGASPMLEDLDNARRLEDAGAPMLIMHSMFEEQLVQEQVSLNWAMEQADQSYSEATQSYLPKPDEFRLGPDEYLEQMRKVKSAVKVPVLGSLNGRTKGGWIQYAKLMEQAGADGIELNVYDLALSAEKSSSDVEMETLEVIRAVRSAVKVPLAVKISAFYTAPVHFAKRAAASGASALVVFNRFYQADIDLENLTLTRELKLSTSQELLLRLRWVAAMHGQVNANLAITGGVHTAEDAIKCVMVGASAVQMVSSLLIHGPRHLIGVKRAMTEWMEAHEYVSLEQMRGCMSLAKTAEPELYERGNYMHILQSWAKE